MIETLPVVDARRPLLTMAAVAALPAYIAQTAFAIVDGGQRPDLATGS